jgi:hypothetical protein
MNKQEAWKYYKTWMKEKTYSSALNSEVKITRKGWDHIEKGTSNKPRNPKDRISRFQLLRIAKYTIKNSKEFEISTRDNHKYYVLSSKSNKFEVKVLLKKDLKGIYYFYSVMKH